MLEKVACEVDNRNLSIFFISLSRRDHVQFSPVGLHLAKEFVKTYFNVAVEIEVMLVSPENSMAVAS